MLKVFSDSLDVRPLTPILVERLYVFLRQIVSRYSQLKESRS